MSVPRARARWRAPAGRLLAALSLPRAGAWPERPDVRLEAVGTASLGRRVAGLDAIRFVCAAAVAVGHLRLPQFGGSPTDLAYAATFNGPAAVIVFFVVSGFCVHYPYRELGSPLDVRAFWVRRLLRIALPALTALALSSLVAVGTTRMLMAILWSLICEAVYYALYPGFRAAAARVGWRPLVAAAYALAALLCATDPGARFYIDHGLAWTWLLGMPVFLLGCALADRADAVGAPAPWTLWLRRLAVWLGSALAVWLCWWSPWKVGYPWTLDAFALLVVPWLAAEIGHFRAARPWGWLERAGKASYSLYLTHLFAHGTLAAVGLRPSGLVAARVVPFLAALALAGAFYLAVERPSLRLGALLAARVRRDPHRAHAAEPGGAEVS